MYSKFMFYNLFYDMGSIFDLSTNTGEGGVEVLENNWLQQDGVTAQIPMHILTKTFLGLLIPIREVTYCMFLPVCSPDVALYDS